MRALTTMGQELTTTLPASASFKKSLGHRPPMLASPDMRAT